MRKFLSVFLSVTLLLTQVSPLAANGYHAELLQDPGSPNRAAANPWAGDEMSAPYVPTSEYKESNSYKQKEIQEMVNRVEAAYRALEEVNGGNYEEEDPADFDSYAADARAACPECNFTDPELKKAYQEFQEEFDTGFVAAEDLLHLLANGLEKQYPIAGTADPYTKIFPKFMMAGWVSEQTQQNFQSLFYYKNIKSKLGNCKKDEKNCPLDDSLLYAMLFGDFGPFAQVFKDGFNNQYSAPSVVLKCGGVLLRIGKNSIYNGSKQTTGYDLFTETVTSIINSAKLQKYPPFEIKKLWEWLMIGSKAADYVATWYNGGVFMKDFNRALYNPKQIQTDNHRNAWAELGQFLGYLATKDEGASAVAQKLVSVVKNKGANYPFALGIVAQQGVKDKDLLKTITMQAMGDMTADDSMYILEGVYQAYRELGGNPKKDLDIFSLQGRGIAVIQDGDEKIEKREAVLAGDIYRALKDRETTATAIRVAGFAVDMIILYIVSDGIAAVLTAILMMIFISALAYAGIIDTESDWFNWTMTALAVIGLAAGARALGVKALRGKSIGEIKTILTDKNLGNVKEVLGSKTKVGAAIQQSLAKGILAERRAFYRMRKGNNAFKAKFREHIAKLKREKKSGSSSRNNDPNGQKPNNSGNRINGQRTNPVPDGNDPHHIVMDEPKPNTPGADYNFNAERIAKEARDAKVRETQAALEKEGWYKDLPSKQQNAVKGKLAELENESWYSDLPVKEKTAISKKMAELENEGWYQTLPAKQQARVAQSMNELEGEGWFSSLPEEGKTAIGEKMSQYSTPEQQKAAAYLERIKQHDGEGRLGGSPEKNAEWLKSVEDAIASDKWSASDTSNLKGVVDRLNNIDSEVNVAEGDYGKLVFDGKYTPGKAPSSTLLIENMPKGRLLRAINERLSSRGMEINNDGVLEGIKSPEDLQFAMRVIEEQTGGKVRFTLHESGSLRRRTTVQMEINDRLAGKKMMLEEDGKAVKGVNNDADLAEAVRIIEEETGSKVTLIPDSSKKGRYLVKIDGKDGLPEFVHNLTPVSYWTKTGADRIRLHIHYEVEVMENGRPVLRNYTIVLDVAELEIEGMKLGTLLDPKNISNNYYGHVELAKRTIKDAQKNPGYPDAKVAEKVQQGLDKAKELRDLLTKFRDAIYRAFSNGRTPDNMEGGLFEVEGMFENPLSGKTKEALEEFRKLRKTSPKPKDFDSWPEWLKERYEEPTFIDLLKEDINILTKEMGYYK